MPYTKLWTVYRTALYAQYTAKASQQVIFVSTHGRIYMWYRKVIAHELATDIAYAVTLQ